MYPETTAFKGASGLALETRENDEAEYLFRFAHHFVSHLRMKAHRMSAACLAPEGRFNVLWCLVLTRPAPQAVGWMLTRK
jgi:hypothetical protein